MVLPVSAWSMAAAPDIDGHNVITQLNGCSLDVDYAQKHTNGKHPFL